MVTCKECKFWDVDYENISRYQADFYKDCLLEGDKFLYNPTIDESKPDTLMYYDPDEYHACFRTGPDFGCIHGKKRDE